MIILYLRTLAACNSLRKPFLLDMGKNRWLREERNKESYFISYFCYACFTGGKTIKPFFQKKTFKAFCVIGLALKSLAGIGIKCYYQTHPHGGYWVVPMIKKWLGSTFLLKGLFFSLKVTICFDNGGREGSYYFYLIIHLVSSFLHRTPHLKPHALL